MPKKKKRFWELAGLALALATWRSISEDLPIHDIIPPAEPPFKPTCKDGERLDWNPSAKRWVCIPKL